MELNLDFNKIYSLLTNVNGVLNSENFLKSLEYKENGFLVTEVLLDLSNYIKFEIVSGFNLEEDEKFSVVTIKVESPKDYLDLTKQLLDKKNLEVFKITDNIIKLIFN